MKPKATALTFVRFCEAIGVALSPAQHALAASCFDGAPVPTEWAHVFGGHVGAVPAGARRTIAILAGRASGKSRIAAAYVLWRILTAPLPKLGKGEIAFGGIVAPSLELARQALRFARGMLTDTPFEGLIVAETSDTFTLRRPDGHTVRVQVFAADRGGAALRGKTFVAAALDESCFFRSKSSNAVVNDGDIHDAIMPRLLAGGAIILASTPWTQDGLLHTFWKDQFGAPTSALVAVAKTEEMRSDDPQILADVAAKRAENPENAAREFDCEWLAVGSGSAFDADALARAVKDTPPRTDGTIAIAGDIGLVSDPSAFVAARIHGDGSVTVIGAREYKPRKGQPVNVEAMLSDVAAWAEQIGAPSSVRVDGHAFAAIQQIIQAAGIPIRLEQISEGADRERRFRYAIDLFSAGRVHIPKEHAHLTEQLSLIVATPRDGGGYKFTAPRRDGHHCDLAMAFVLVCEGALSIATFSAAMSNTQGLASINAELQIESARRSDLDIDDGATLHARAAAEYETKRNREDPICIACGSRQGQHLGGKIAPFVARSMGVAPCPGFRAA